MMQLKILVADDEPFARDDLVFLLEKSESELLSVSQAQNGAEALELMRAEPYDIVFLDIQMPVLGGLDFLAQARTDHPDTYYVVVTCHDDFEYARRALTYGARDYILKPVDEDAFFAAFDRALKTIEASRKARSELGALRREMRNLRVEHALYQWLGGLREAELPQVRAAAVVQLFETETTAAAEALFSLHLMLGRHCEARQITLLRAMDADHQLVLAGEDAEMITALLRDNLALMQEYHGEEGIFVAGLAARDEPAGLGPLVLEARNALMRRFASGEAFFTGQAAGDDAQAAPVDDTRGQALALCGQLGQKPQQRAGGAATVAAIADLITALPHQAAAALFEEVVARLSSQEEAQAARGLGQMRTAYALRTYLMTLANAGDERSGPAGPGSLAEDVREYLQKNYDKPITLSSVGRTFYVNPTYLSEVYKRRTGSNFMDDLIGIRMKHAGRLLATTSIRVGEVGTLCGYSSQTYFQRAFKKYTGLTPLEYRLKKCNKTPKDIGF